VLLLEKQQRVTSMLHHALPETSRARLVPPSTPQFKESDEVSRGAVEMIPALRAFALSLTRHRSRADDLVQDTLLKMIDNRGQFLSGSNLRAWAFTIMRHTHINTARRAVNRPTADLDEARCEAEGSQTWHMENLDLQAALDELSPEHRDVVVMVGALGLSYEEAAEACGCPVGTIKSRLFRGRALLASRLGYESAEWRSPGL
jgi:RNA polymerase sigma-70 factor (ECF subfamily)